MLMRMIHRENTGNQEMGQLLDLVHKCIGPLFVTEEKVKCVDSEVEGWVGGYGGGSSLCHFMSSESREQGIGGFKRELKL